VAIAEVPWSPLGLELDQGRGNGADGRAERQPLHGPRHEQGRGALRQRQQDQAERGDGQPAHDHRPATDPVGELPEDQQRRDQRHRVDSEDQRQRRAREAEIVAVDRVQRRGQVAVQQQHEQRAGDDHERRRALARRRSWASHRGR
jgi:hypothetical protein